ncbi:hypothetical protein AVEN_24590-1 [Araneus ventricosus]|uniref:Uncharacterized protein n=1 Tax=Araneus ventricosus TaxID=182803 RepID=A0A4Y2FCU4_ARAVE|nr:hypothetical protein AVEN_24590-1 [Araneus ventricosus]
MFVWPSRVDDVCVANGVGDVCVPSGIGEVQRMMTNGHVIVSTYCVLGSKEAGLEVSRTSSLSECVNRLRNDNAFLCGCGVAKLGGTEAPKASADATIIAGDLTGPQGFEKALNDNVAYIKETGQFKVTKRGFDGREATFTFVGRVLTRET